MRADAAPFFEPPFIALAHRGGATYPPNLQGEQPAHSPEAAALGYRYLEIDVHATAGGVPLPFTRAIKLVRVADGLGLRRLDLRAGVSGQDPWRR